MNGKIILASLLLASTASSSAFGQPKLTPIEIGRLNAQAIASLHSLRVHVAVSDATATPAQPAGDRLLYEYDWCSQGDNQKLHRITHKSDGTLAFDTVVNGPSECRALTTVNSEDLSALSAENAAGAKGSTGPRVPDRDIGGSCPKADLMLWIWAFHKPYSLQELIQQSQRTTVVYHAEDPLPTYELDITVPEGRVLARVAPRYNYLLTRAEVHGSGAGDAEFYEKDASAFKESKPGLYLPSKATASLHYPKGVADTNWEISWQSVNEEIPPGEFILRFPEWLRVVDRATDKVQVWGPDDQPRKTFDTYLELERWSSRNSNAWFSLQSYRRQWFFGGVGVSVMLLGCYFYLRRPRSRA